MTVAVLLNTKPCIHCGKKGSVMVSGEGYLAYINGAFVQDAFPDLALDLREQIISGTHPACWQKMFGDIDE